LREYDPALAVLCERVFGDLPWRYQKPSLRAAADREHLGAYPIAQSPKFQWRQESLGEQPLVLIQTSLGDIEVELDAKAAPLTVANFIYYVHEGLLADGEFFRVVRQDNQASDAVTIAVVQGKANELKQAQFLAPIPIERTSQTGLKHRDGTLSMAREAPDSGQHHFFFCIGDQPELDFAGRRNPDGQGFAAFGQVTKGMDIIKKIHKLPTQSHNPQLLVEPVKIQRAIRRR
jgi:peptidyl-prolyl cis-trans isomerase A (cyclophilin A)